MTSATRIKPVFRRDGIQGIYRLFRITWVRGRPGTAELGKNQSRGRKGYSAKLSFALSKRLFAWEHESRHDYDVHILFLRVHYCRSYGGVMV